MSVRAIPPTPGTKELRARPRPGHQCLAEALRVGSKLFSLVAMPCNASDEELDGGSEQAHAAEVVVIQSPWGRFPLSQSIVRSTIGFYTTGSKPAHRPVGLTSAFANCRLEP